MVKFIQKIITIIRDNYFLAVIAILGIALYVYVFTVTIYNIKYFDNYVEGIIIGRSTETTSDIDGAGYYYFNYKILCQSDTLYSNTDRKYVLEMNDNVYGRKTSKNTIRIICVNGQKIQYKYGLDDYMSVSVIIISVCILIFYLKKRKK